MRIGRTLPPAAAPLFLRDILSGLMGIVAGESEVERLKQELKSHFNKKHCFLLSSGKAALTLILLALKQIHPDRTHVLIPAFACFSIPSAIVRAGLQVQLCDIDLHTLDFDYDKLEDKIKNPELLCVVSLHLFGLPADVERLREMISDPNVTIVEDAAQAMGGEWRGKKLGTQGDVGFFSLGRGKALTAVEGGIILTDDENLGKQLEFQVNLLPACNILQLIHHFVYAVALVLLLRPALFWIPNALPFLRLGETHYEPNFLLLRFSPFQAGLMRGMKEKLRTIKLERTKNIRLWVGYYSNLMVKCIGSQQALPDLLRFPLLIRGEKVVERLLEQSTHLGLGFARTYPDSIDCIPEIKKQFAGQSFPKARQASQEILTLPVHRFLNDNDRKQIIRLLADEEAIAGARS